MRNRQIGHIIASAAILVQAPRLVLALLAADRQPVETSWQRGLLVIAGIGTAVVLTGGNLYLAHTLATATRWRGKLGCVWLVVLLSSGSLVVPLIAGGLEIRAAAMGLGRARCLGTRGHRGRLHAGRSGAQDDGKPGSWSRWSLSAA